MPKVPTFLALVATLALSAPAHPEGGVPGALNALAEQNQTSAQDLLEALAAQTDSLLAGLAALAPAPSELVLLKAGLTSNGCVNPPGATMFDTRLLPDGTDEPFTVPEGKVLVVTDIEVLGFGGPAGDNTQTRIFSGIGFATHEVAVREAIQNADGRVYHVLQFNSGFVVPTGGEVCMNNSDNLTLTGRLRGALRDAP